MRDLNQLIFNYYHFFSNNNRKAMIANKVESFPTVMGNNSAMAPNHFATSSNHLKLNNRRNGNIASVPASVSNSRSRLHAQFVTIERRQKIQKKKKFTKNKSKWNENFSTNFFLRFLPTYFLSFFLRNNINIQRDTHTHTQKPVKLFSISNWY